MEENMAIELNDFVEKVLRDLAGFVPVGAKVWFEVSPTYLPPLGFDDKSQRRQGYFLCETMF